MENDDLKYKVTRFARDKNTEKLSNSDQTKKDREMIFGIHVHIIQESIHAKFQEPAS